MLLSRKTILLVPVLFCFPGGAWAADEPDVYEEIVVIGQAGMMQMALERQQAADNIISALNADAIGELPDNNMAEALQRVPGVSIERDQGEGRFVRVRGIGPDLNAVSVNGVQLPAPEAGRRAVALDVIPASLLNSVIISKTLTPDMDANSIGGSIDVESISALDRPRAFYSIKAEAGFDELTEQASPGFSLSGGNVFNRGGDTQLGVVAALSWDERKFGSDNTETGGAWEFDDNDALLEEFEQRDYEIERERTGAALNFDLAVAERHRFFWRTLYSEFTDVERRLANIFEFGEETLNDDNELEFDGAGRAEGELGLAEVTREIKQREETQDILATSIGGEHQLAAWTLAYSLGYSEASEEEPGGIDPAVFEGGVIDNTGFFDTREPGPSTTDDFYDPSTFVLSEVEYVEALTEDQQTSVKFDLSRSWQRPAHSLTLKFGAKATQREKTQDATVYVFEDFEDAGFSEQQLSLAAFSGGEVDYRLGAFGRDINSDGIWDIIGQMDAGDFLDQEESRIGDHTIDEDVVAAYFMTRFEADPWMLLMGLRFEGTTQDFSGVAFDGDEAFTPVSAENDYDHFLPNVQVKYAFAPNTQMRAAWTQSVVRPTFEQLAPSFIDDGEEAELGNPQLEALTASNIDLGIEHFSGTAGVLSAFLFYKDLENFVYATDLAGTPEWAEYDEVITYRNGERATITGLELAWSRKLEQLPAPFDGLLVGVNATFSDSEADIAGSDDGEFVSRDIPLPNQSDTTGNLILGYETDRVALRLALNYKSEYLLEVSDITDAALDVYQDEQTQVDLTAKYLLSERLSLSFDVNNLLDEPYYTYVNQPRFNAQYEEYGVSYRVSLSWRQL